MNRPATYKEAMAAGRDAGNRSMKKAMRTSWSKADWDAATEAFEKLTGALNKFKEQEPEYEGVPFTG